MPVAIRAISSANKSSARTVCDSSMMCSRAAKHSSASAIGIDHDERRRNGRGKRPRRPTCVRLRQAVIPRLADQGVARAAPRTRGQAPDAARCRCAGTPHHLQEAEAHQIGAERNAQIDDPTRPFELGRHLIRIELVDVDRAERADDAGEKRAANQREHDHRPARRRGQSFDQDIDADMDAGAYAERGAEFRHPHEHVGGKLLRPGQIDRGQRDVDPVSGMGENDKPVRRRPAGQHRRIAGAITMHDRDEGQDRRRARSAKR